MQEAYWIGRRTSFVLGNVGAYLYLELERSDVDLERVEQAWNELITRHDALRTIILPDGRQQVLSDTPRYSVAVHDLREQPRMLVEEQLGGIRQRLSHQLFRSDQWPLFVVEISLLPEGRVRVHWGLDMLICDAWSVWLLIDDWSLRYSNVSLPTLDLSFRDCVLAEYDMRATSTYAEAWRYWADRLDSIPNAPQLPLALDPEQILQPRFCLDTTMVDPVTWHRIQQRAAAVSVTATAVLLTMYAEVLALYSGDGYFTLNVTLFNRPPVHPQVDNIVGDFTSLVPFVADCRKRCSFQERVRFVQQQLWTDLDHRAVSSLRVMRERARRFGSKREGLLPIVFTSTLGFGRDVKERDTLWDDDKGLVFTAAQTPQVWLDLGVFATVAGGLRLTWSFVDGLFPTETISGLKSSLEKLILRLADASTDWNEDLTPEIPQSQLAARLRLNAPAQDTRDVRLDALFLEQVPVRLNATAVIAPSRTLTYVELERESRAVALRLLASGSPRPRVVAVVMDKGWEQVVAVLGILRAGAAYLPIDVHLPRDRQHMLLTDAGVTMALTQAEVDRELTWPVGIARIAVDELTSISSSDYLDLPLLTPDDLAYVIYTSGSTGMPKGVMITHAGAVNTILDVNRRCALSCRDRVLAVSSLNFDLSVWDIFGTLAAGGTIVLPPRSAHPDPALWLWAMSEHQVTVWNSVPALLQLLLQEVESRGQQLRSLRMALLSGDWIPVSLPDQLRRIAPDVALLAMGGATEASIWSIYEWVETVDPTWSSIPYGRPLANQSFHILNEQLRPSPVWTPGELYIGGCGVARGYWGDSSRTSESFINHPDTGERLYRTGDLGRYWPDGRIEFLGRRDTQVKISGNRIELGEIEFALARHPSVQACAVTADGPSRGRRRLVAYIVLRIGSVASTEELNRFLRAKLPDYMVPRTIVFLGGLPLSANGKIDRVRLPDPPQDERDGDYQAPRTPIEQAVATIWAKALRQQRIGIHDNFFELGGDSLAAMDVVVKLREYCTAELDVMHLFDRPTIAEFVELM